MVWACNPNMGHYIGLEGDGNGSAIQEDAKIFNISNVNFPENRKD